MIIAIRISGQVGLPSEIDEALHRLKLRRKYAAILISPNSQNLKLLKKLRNYIAYGEIEEKTLLELLRKRAQPIKGKVDAEKIIKELDKKSLKDLGIKPFFRLHPPRKGIESKKHFGIGKGVLGDHKEKINDLVRRML